MYIKTLLEPRYMQQFSLFTQLKKHKVKVILTAVALRRFPKHRRPHPLDRQIPVHMRHHDRITAGEMIERDLEEDRRQAGCE